MDQTIKQKDFLLYRDIKFDIKHGMNVTKKQIVFQFTQSP